MKRAINTILDHTFDLLPVLLALCLACEPAHRMIIAI